MTSNEFRNNVGQVVNGNAASESTAVTGNVVNVSFTTPEIDPGPPVTKDQRSKIFQAVRRLLIALGKDPDDDDDRHEVYSLIRAEFSLKRIENLPASKYKEALFFIDKLMQKTRTQVFNDTAKEIENISITKPCTTCSQLDRKLSNWKKSTFSLAVGLVVLVGTLGFSLVGKTQQGDRAAEVTQVPEQCSYNGVNHSAGAKIKMADNQLHECTANGVWQKFSTNKEKAVPKRVKIEEDF